MGKATVAQPPPKPDMVPLMTPIIDVENALNDIALRIRAVAQTLYDDCGETLAGSKDECTYALFEILIDALNTAAERIDAQSDRLSEWRKPAVA